MDCYDKLRSYFHDVDTTDVQHITVMHSTTAHGTKPVAVYCEVITNSDAKGCLVVLTVDGYDNVTFNLTRGDNTSYACSTVEDVEFSGEVTGVVGYDVESDGSIGNLAISGKVVRTVDYVFKCSNKIKEREPSDGSCEPQNWLLNCFKRYDSAVVLGVSLSSALVLVGSIVITLSLSVVLWKFKTKR